ncbi:MAG: PQQ-binding-like beta-propeller repeat protein [Pirellulaceae bacterium]|nr:PQQ-binding-like beta-propeller repeat protein [Pirellulaceae bacterium]
MLCRRSLLFLSPVLLAGVCLVVIFACKPRTARLRVILRPVPQPTVDLATGPAQSLMAPRSPQSPTWSRFRGDNGTGTSSEVNIPIQWSETENLQWKCKLPGAGSSSPILTEQYVFLTAYSGYGQSWATGELSALKRHVLCIDRTGGTIVWDKTYDATQQEDAFQGMGLPEHGYATNSCTTDGDKVFAFLGKSGVVAFDLDGHELWRVSVGTDSSNRHWGSAASLILYDDLVIVNGAEESQTLYGINKADGQVVWQAPAGSLELCYSTPAVCRVSDDRDDLVLAVAGEIWGINPKTGKLLWYALTPMAGNLSPSVIIDGTMAYAFGGRQPSGSVAVEVGGQGDVTQSHVRWTSQATSYVSTPVLVAGKFYWIDDRGIYCCLDASTGKQLVRTRGHDLGGGRPVYASPIAVNNTIYIQSRKAGVLVLDAKEELTIVAHNRIASDDSQFNATPAVDRGQLYLRSDDYLYCFRQNGSQL